MTALGLARSLVVATLALTLAACGQGAAPPVKGEPSAGEQRTPGALSVTLEGLPSGAGATFTLQGPGGFKRTFSANQHLSLQPGTYTLSADDFTLNGERYAATVEGSLVVTSNRVSAVKLKYARQRQALPTAQLAWSLSDDEQDLEYDSVASDAQGNVYVLAYLKPDSPRAIGFGDPYVTKINAQGQKVWSKRLGDGGYERGTSLVVTADGEVVVSGRTEPDPSTNYTYFNVNLDRNGRILFDTRDSRVNFFAARQSEVYGFRYDFNPKDGTLIPTIAKLARDGSVTRTLLVDVPRTFKIVPGSSVINGFTIGTDGNAYVFGYDEPGPTFEPKQQFVAKIDLATGKTIWFRTFTNGISARIENVFTDSHDDLFVYWYSDQDSIPPYQYFIKKYTADGTWLFNKPIMNDSSLGFSKDLLFFTTKNPGVLAVNDLNDEFLGSVSLPLESDVSARFIFSPNGRFYQIGTRRGKPYIARYDLK